MSDNRKRPSFAVTVAVAIFVGALLFPLSFGPAYWLLSNGAVPRHVTWSVYRPVIRHVIDWDGAFRCYCQLWGADRRTLAICDAAFDYIDCQ